MYDMGIRPLKIFYSFSAGTDFRRQNLTYLDVRLKSVAALKELNTGITGSLTMRRHSYGTKF